MKVGLMGGSFDPIHNGHIKLALAAHRQLHLSTVFLVLTPRSPFKKEKIISPVSQRLRWLKASIKGKKGLKIGIWELRKKGPVYTVDTLRSYRRRHPHDEVYFIMGSDAWKGFPRWKQPEGIQKLAKLVVGRRPGTSQIKVSKHMEESVTVLQGVFPKISSTQIRNAVKKGQKISKSFLPSAVWKDINHEKY